MFNFTYLRQAFKASKYGKAALVVLFAGLIIASVGLAVDLRPAQLADAAFKVVQNNGANRTAEAQTDECNPMSDLAYTSIQAGSSATASLTNNSETCTYHAGLASYRVYDHSDGTDSQTQPFIMTQQLHRTNLRNIAPGQTINFSVALPSCAYQVDLFEGPNAPVPPQFGLLTSTHTIFTWKIDESLDLCGETTPPPVCSPSTQTVQVGETANFSANSGTGSYSWSVSGGGSPSSGVGSSFHTSFNTPGNKTVTVTSGGLTDQCHVIVQQQSDPPVYCSPSTQTVSVGGTAYFTASGGNGTYNWTASGNPPSGTGSSFHTSYSTSGTKTVTVTSGARSAQCTVVVQPVVTPDISCSPSNQTVNVGDTAAFSASGGDGAFHWTASGGDPSTGSGQSFATTYGTSGSKLVLVNDNSGHSAQCNVQVNPIVVGAPSCNPTSQDADVDETVFFSATGGNGSYAWTAGGGSPSSGNGSSFHTSYHSDGTKIVTVTSNGLSDQCVVYVDEESNDDLDCSPNDQEVDVDEWVTFHASGGSGGYEWEADDGDPDEDTGSNFTTRFDDEGRYTVRVRDDEGHTATCKVDVEEDYSPRRPSCTPSSQTANVNERVEFYAHGGTGDYEWDADDGSPRYGYGSRFSTSFDEPGDYEVELESNGETDICEIEIRDYDDDAPFCSPSVQNANVNDYVTFSASGGNGSYFWSTSADGSPSTGSGSSFGTRFITPGNKLVMVSSNGRTSQCLVQIGSVLGASTVITGPTETAAAAAGLGLFGALGAYGAVYRDRSKKLFAKLARLIRR